MARNQPSAFLWNKILVNYFFHLAHEVARSSFQRLGVPLVEVGSRLDVAGRQTYQNFCRSLSKTRDMPKKSELLLNSHLRVPPLLPMLLWLAAWYGQRGCMLVWSLT